jgi:hypothetical protein
MTEYLYHAKFCSRSWRNDGERPTRFYLCVKLNSSGEENKQQTWWCTPVILVYGKTRQEDREFQDSLGYIERFCVKKERENKKKGRKKKEKRRLMKTNK